ncbi:hypothetical protein LC087_18900 (plasmid) [Bacillus carboniphilus]|uniref:Uncharacterized protein n=1 Tax=Bacillus carboniphilus TaxID=86663 RepID=A0ABY9K089_9BACI|nr:hypothetical protein [Bacillus carboniphilus]WLR44453.1 hypothetical protein LC087_18900 [Bacillus carboniphilus]
MNAPIPKEEKHLIYEYIYTVNMVGILEHKKFEKYAYLIPVLRTELREIKVKMKDLKIEVEEPVQVDDWFVEYPYRAHGYHGTMRFWKFAIKLELNKRLKRYIEG